MTEKLDENFIKSLVVIALGIMRGKGDPYDLVNGAMEYLISNKEYLLANKPEIYYSMKGQKLPKKYQQKQGVSITPVNAFVPPQSKLSKNELREQLNKEAEERKYKAQKESELRQENKRKEMIKQRNQNAYAREQSYIHWVDPYTPINHNKLGSSQAWKIEKKYKYYD